MINNLEEPSILLQKNELPFLPENFEDVLASNNIQLNNIQITQLLLDGYLYLDESLTKDISAETPLLVTSENVLQYVKNEIEKIESYIESRAQDQLRKDLKSLRIQILLMYPFSKGEDQIFFRELLKGNFPVENSDKIAKLLNISSRTRGHIPLTSIKPDIKSSQIKESITKEFTNPMYIEENAEFYNQLKDYIKQREESLRSTGIYNDDYSQLLADIDSVINNDDTIFKSIYPNNSKYILLTTNEDLLLTISRTDTLVENTMIDENNFNKEYDIEPLTQGTKTVRVPVLMYHQIDSPPIGSSSFVSGLYTSPEMFEQQIAYLTKKNYKTLNSEEFYHILQSGQNPTQKSIVLSFDDGTISHYTHAYKILKKYNQKGVFFVTSGRTQLSSEQLKEMSNNGMDIQSHTQTHPDLTKLIDLDRLQNEIGGSKVNIEARTGKKVISIAYPGCVANTKAFQSVVINGYLLGFSCGKSIDHRYSSRVSLSRVHNPCNLEDMKKILSGIYPF